MFKFNFICRSIRNKLLIIVGLGTSLVMAVTIWTLFSNWNNFQGLRHVIDEDLGLKSEVQELNLAFTVEVQAWKNVLLRGSQQSDREKYWSRLSKQFEATESKVQQLVRDLKIVHGDPQTAGIMERFSLKHREMYQAYQKGLQVLVDSNFDIQQADATVKGVDREPAKLLGEVVKVMDDESKLAVGRSEERFVSAIRAASLALVVAIILSFILFLIMVQKNIVGPAQQLMADLKRMAEGDFGGDISVASIDEIGQVAASARTLHNDMGTIVQKINQSVYSLSASAEEMAHVTDQSNQAMMQQRAETDQVATAMNEMTATVHEVAQNAQLAASSASQANEQVNTGQGVVNEAIRAIASLVQKVERASDVIHNLENDSVEIGSVLDVIRSIAEQTNLLALNAAIEAARAGEQGRGFAVVADEVRVLAQRTQKSTEEIQAMIQRLQSGAQEAVEAMSQSRSQADTTRDTAARAGEVLTAITAAVTNINDMNTLIASAAEEQNAVAEEINRNIVNISQGSEATADAAAQTARASEDLRNVAEELKHVISNIKV